MTLYYWNTTSSTWTSLGGNGMGGSAYVGLYFSAQSSAGSVAYTNFLSSHAYPTSGRCTSSIYDAGRSAAWGTLSCNAVVPGGTGLQFQVAVSNALTGPWVYVGPDGTSGTSFTSFPATLPTLAGQYFRYRATLTGDGTATPELTRVDVTFAGTNTSTARTYAYDAAGNMTLKVTLNPSGGPAVEVRDDPTWSSSDRINDLNQILRNDVTTNAVFDSALFDFSVYDASGGSLTTYRYTYDASGNLTSKTDGTNTWLYQWDEDNRLTLVALPDESTIAYTYDVDGRMLTRTDLIGTTRFEWDGFDCVRETGVLPIAMYDTATYDSGATYDGVGPIAVATQYYVLQGQLLSVVRNGVRCAIVSDALGSVRMVAGPDGTVVARFDYDAWGNLLDSSYDDVPGGMPYRFVGAYGVRWDEGAGLHYMRQRWYCCDLGRFLSRDTVSSMNRFACASNQPENLVDVTGLDSIPLNQTDEYMYVALSPVTFLREKEYSGYRQFLNALPTTVAYATGNGKGIFWNPAPSVTVLTDGAMSFRVRIVYMLTVMTTGSDWDECMAKCALSSAASWLAGGVGTGLSVGAKYGAGTVAEDASVLVGAGMFLWEANCRACCWSKYRNTTDTYFLYRDYR